MNQNERENVAKTILGCFSVYGRDVSKEAILFMVNSLDKFPHDKVIEAIHTYAQTDTTGRPPTVGAIVEIINPTASPETLANDAASRIRQAISKFGWPDPEGARAFIGELGWVVVQRFGGWQYVCENHGDELSVTTFHAQARDIAKSQLEMEKLGIRHQPPALTGPQAVAELDVKPKSISNLPTLKEMPK